MPLEYSCERLAGARGEGVELARGCSQCCVAFVDIQAEAEVDGAGGEDARGYIQGDHGVALTLGDGILRREAEKKGLSAKNCGMAGVCQLK